MSTSPPVPKGAERFGAWFDAAAADAACAFFPRYLRHTEGEWAGKPFTLADWQRDDVVRPLFGWKRADGTRLHRRAYIEVGKKNGKTELAAGLAVVLLVGDGEFGGQGFSIATDKDQAKIVFGKAGLMVSMSEELAERIDVFKTSIYCADLAASFKPLSSVPTGKHGFSVSFLIGDELHEWADDRVYDAAHKNTAARRQPLEVLITTAGLKGKGVAWEMHEHARKVLEGTLDDPELLVAIYAADEDDDWTDEAVWRKANPNLGVSPKLEFLRSECVKAQRSPRLENEFRRFHLDQWVGQVVRWLPMKDWDACTRDPKDPELWRRLEAELAGRPCWGGLDLGSTRDTTALCWAFPPLEDGERWHFLWRIFLPEADLAARCKRDDAPYDAWADQGALILTPGNVTDYRAVKEQVFADAAIFRVGDVAIDRWNATQVAVDLADEGLEVELFGQGYASMSAPSKDLERMVLSHQLEHGNHPVARWMAENVSVLTDPAGNIKPAKDVSTGRIDGIVAQIMAEARAVAGQGDDETIDLPEDYEVAVA